MEQLAANGFANMVEGSSNVPSELHPNSARACCIAASKLHSKLDENLVYSKGIPQAFVKSS